MPCCSSVVPLSAEIRSPVPSPFVYPIRRRKKGKERPRARINTDRNATVGSGTAASARITRRRQQALMGKRVRDGRDRCRCLYLAEAFIAHKKECSVMH